MSQSSATPASCRFRAGRARSPTAAPARTLTITINLAAAAGKTTYLTGLQITATGATAAGVVQPTVYLAGSNTTLYFVFAVPAGVNTSAQPLILTFPNPVSAGGTNAVIQIILPALGSGNTNAAVSAQGYQL